MSMSTLRVHGAERAGTPTAAVSPWRVFDVHVQRTTALSPHFLRVTLAGPDLDRFADLGCDQRLQVVLPLPGSGTDWLPTPGERWWQRWQALSADRRNLVRTYTARAVRPARHELDIDLVRHGGGSAAGWFARARRGDRLQVVGADADYPGDHGGRAFQLPGPARRVLLAGDETAVPALAAIGASLPEHVGGHVLIEVPTARDFGDLTLPSGVEVCWVARGAAPRGRGLLDLIRQTARDVLPTAPSVAEPEGEEDRGLLWEVPAAPSRADAYAWVAADADTVQAVRRHLLHDLRADRRTAAFMSYWRDGSRQC
jgi:NADPH-dependent ferric siderophore reductase